MAHPDEDPMGPFREGLKEDILPPIIHLQLDAGFTLEINLRGDWPILTFGEPVNEKWSVYRYTKVPMQWDKIRWLKKMLDEPKTAAYILKERR